MNKIIALLPVSVLAFFLANLSVGYAQEDPVYFASHPTLSPDARSIVFSFEGDLWRTNIAGGAATRVTALPGEEINPKISPDGKWLAFSSNQFGNYDVFVMPLAGGEIRQLTHHEANDEVESWGWDSETIYFTSGRYNRFSSYRVSREGGTAVRVFPHYFNTIHQVTEMPDGALLFNNTWESYTAANRKGYKGAFNPDILSYHPETGAFEQLTDYSGKDFWQTVDRQGAIYFASDEGNGQYNLYTFAPDGRKIALTRFDSAIKRPQVSADGSKVVFERDYQIYVYDVKSRKSTRLPLSVYRNPVLAKEQENDVKDNISAFDVSPDGKKLAFVSRGELFVSDVDGKFVRQIHSMGERIFEVKWLSDNQTLIYNQTYNGYPNWYSASADGQGTPRQLTSETRSNRDLTFSPDRKHGVYLSGRDEVRVMDLSSLKSRTVVKDEIWAFQNSSPSFSPDGAYVLFTAVRNFEQDIFVHHLGSGKTINLTNTGVSEAGPVWSPDGKAIYYASNRTRPAYPYGMQDASVYRMELADFDRPYRSEKFDQLFEENKEVDKKDAKNPGEDADKKESNPDSANTDVVRIDVDGLRDRIRRVSPGFGSQTAPQAVRKGNKDFVFFNSNHESGRWAVYRIVMQDFEDDKTEKVADGGLSNLLEAGGKYFALSRGSIQKYNIDNNKLDKVEISFKFRRNLNDEFRQMFLETWAGIEENFYDADFHGVDWERMKKNYSRFLPYVNNRADLRTLLNDLLGELNSSHLGFSSRGREEQTHLRYVTNETGIVFRKDAPYEVMRIAANSNAGRIGRDIRPGDVLIEVDGVAVDPSVDRDYYFTRPSLAEELRLTFRRGGETVQTTVRPQSAGTLREQFYDEWIRQNRKRVDSLSGDRIAYSHMKNMSGGELESFLLDMVEQENNKEAIVLDLRYNTGGNVHDEVLKFLSQRPYLQWQYRGGKRAPQGHFAPAGKPIVLLINEQSLSDAEMTAAGFKALGLGTVIGTETYRWIIFTSAKGLVDGSSYRVPAWGCYTLEGDNLELTGVAPDIYVKNTVVDRIEGRDPQLERAVQVILEELAN